MRGRRSVFVPPAATVTLANLHDLPTMLQRTEGFAPVPDALRRGRSATIDGAWGSAAALAAATLALETPHTLLVVIAHPRDLDGWAGDLASFSGLRPVLFPAWDNQPGDPADEVASQRLRVLKQLEGSSTRRLILATVQALLQPVPDRAQLAASRRTLTPGEVSDPDDLAAWLVAHGYR